MTIEYCDGTSLIHRAPALAKLGVFIAVGVLLAGCTTPTPALCCAALFASCFWWIVGTRRLVRALVLANLLVLPSFIYAPFSIDPALSITRGVAIAATVLGSFLLTTTTSPTHLLSALTRVLTPVLGTRYATRVSLSASLCIRFVPLALQAVSQTREAAQARNIHLTPWNVFVPTLVRLVGTALLVGDAIETRHITK